MKGAQTQSFSIPETDGKSVQEKENRKNGFSEIRQNDKPSQQQGVL